MRSIRCALTLSALLLASYPALGGELKGVEMPDQITLGDTTLSLNGMALRSKLMFKVYVAGMYLPTKARNADVVFRVDGLRQMKMHWLRGVGKDAICEGWYEGLEANTPNASAALKKQFDDLCAAMRDAEDGQVFAFTYTPEKGTEVDIDGTTTATLEGKEFADALWACWIGPHPGPGEDFKKALLGN